MDRLGYACPLKLKALKKFYKPSIWWRRTALSQGVGAEMGSVLPAVHAMSDETSPLSTSEERPEKDNELFQQFLPESTHNALYLRVSAEVELPSSATTPRSSKPTLHCCAPHLQLFTGHHGVYSAIKWKNTSQRGGRGVGAKININGCAPNWLVGLIKDTITRLCCNQPPFTDSVHMQTQARTELDLCARRATHIQQPL